MERYPNMRKPVLFLAAISLLSISHTALAGPKNVILMVSDGRSPTAVEATRYWRGKPAVYEGKGWVKYWQSTSSADNDWRNNPLGYNPAKAWLPNGNGGLKPNQAYLKSNATDSASGITALVTGHRNEDGSINWDIAGKPLQNFAQIYKADGRAAGALSTVHWTHATPAGIGAHNVSRSNYVDIATEMLTKSDLDVIIGAGHPFFDGNGKPVAKPDFKNIGEENWNKLKDGSYGFTLIETRDAFLQLANAATTPSRVCGTYQALSTSQQGRDKYDPTDVPGSDPLNANIPTMSEMALAALNVLDNNEKGFFIMMEGGAIDWAAHANQSSRLIEEHMDFDDAVEAVSKWVEKNSSWKDTLVIITSDHGNGMITGPNGETHVVNNGKGRMPGLKWNSGGHTNELVPVYARGAGADLFKQMVAGVDPVRGAYCDNTDIFRVMVKATGVR